MLILGFLAALSIMVHYGVWGGLKGWLILLAIGFGNTAFNIANEIMDFEQDSINKPYKPLPSNAVSIRAAYHICILSFTASAVCVVVVLTLFSP
ncbi:MAG: UbiA family prenyltransferase, partial [Methermicoccaceae archaeon]